MLGNCEGVVGGLEEEARSGSQPVLDLTRVPPINITPTRHIAAARLQVQPLRCHLRHRQSDVQTGGVTLTRGRRLLLERTSCRLLI